MRHVMEYSARKLSHAFDHALGSPFNNLRFYPVLSRPDSLYSAYIVFISASTVLFIKYLI
jgi:hypothetical protein